MQTMEPRLVACILAAVPDCLAIYIFGSRASGAASAHSDLDMAIMFSGQADILRVWALAGDLADLAGCPVDLVDLVAASTVMQYQVITTGRRIWCRNPQAGAQAGIYEAFILSEKTDLDERRSALIADIGREGRVHGR